MPIECAVARRVSAAEGRTHIQPSATRWGKDANLCALKERHNFDTGHWLTRSFRAQNGASHTRRVALG